MTGTLILVRHGESEGNLQNVFTGRGNPNLTDRGIEQARAAGRLLAQKGLVPDAFYTSGLRRAQMTLDLMLDQMGIQNVTITRNAALNERDYGDLAGMNKDDARARWGVEQVLAWRRSLDGAPPGGESLGDTAGRVDFYCKANILPRIKAGETVLVTAHGNSLLVLVMAIEGLAPDAIMERELATGQPLIYTMGMDGELEAAATGL